jgi:hypothetical protein
LLLGRSNVGGIMADRIDVWIGDKNKPALKETPKGTVLEIQCLQQTESYDAWLSNGKQGDAPERYLYVTVSFWGSDLQAHGQKIYEKAIALRAAKDPRPHMHVIGKWGRTREYNGKNYADFRAYEASPLIFGPLQQRGTGDAS